MSRPPLSLTPINLSVPLSVNQALPSCTHEQTNRFWSNMVFVFVAAGQTVHWSGGRGEIVFSLEQYDCWWQSSAVGACIEILNRRNGYNWHRIFVLALSGSPFFLTYIWVYVRSQIHNHQPKIPKPLFTIFMLEPCQVFRCLAPG